MPTDDNTDEKFLKFGDLLGLRPEHMQALWNADIRKPQELAAADKASLSGICNNPYLLNQIHPLLNKYAVHIALAPDPYEKAVSIIKRNMEMETDTGSIASDAGGFVGNHVQPTTGAVPEGPSSNRGSTNWTPEQRDSTTISNNGANVRASGGNVVQTSVGKSPYTDGKHVVISGGNFVQANVMGKGPVTYHNTDTTITTNLGPGKNGDYGVDFKNLRMKKLKESFVLDGTSVDVSDMEWQDTTRREFWPDEDFEVNRSSMDLLMRRVKTGQVYRVQNAGGSRALIINNHVFTPRNMKNRAGADRDSRNMKKLFEKLGFQVESHENKTATEMEHLLQDFAKSEDNMQADMIAIYIGSHGERDDRANDTFVGVDGNRVNFNEVKKWFTPDACPLLHDKPKIFFLQFCRQEAEQTTIEGDGITEADADTFPTETNPPETRLMDCISVYATLAGNKAYRDIATGSWFVSALVCVLKDNIRDDDLLSMLTEVNNSVARKSGQEKGTRAVQISEVLHTLRKKIYFYPGLRR